MKITGRTRVYGILADPIHHVKTPEAMHLVFARHGVDGVLVPIHVTAAGLSGMIAGLRQMRNFGGFIATVPHKPAMVELCDEVDAHARLIGAANIVRREPDGRMVGAMLDNRWLVYTECDLCALRIRADLKRIARARGPGFVLWGRSTPDVTPVSHPAITRVLW